MRALKTNLQKTLNLSQMVNIITETCKIQFKIYFTKVILKLFVILPKFHEILSKLCENYHAF